MVLQLIVEWRFGTLSLCDKKSSIVFMIHSAPQQPKESAARHIREHCILLDSSSKRSLPDVYFPKDLTLHLTWQANE